MARLNPNTATAQIGIDQIFVLKAIELNMGRYRNESTIFTEAAAADFAVSEIFLRNWLLQER
jgi:hypothetical protein